MNDPMVGEQSDLREYLRILRRRRLTIAATVLVLVALALMYSFLRTPVYSASTNVLIPQSSTAAQLNPSSATSPDAVNLARTLSDEVDLAKSDQVRRAAEAVVGRPATVAVSAATTSDELTFTCRDEHRGRAAAMATAFANGYIATRDKILTAQYTQDTAALKASIAQLQTPGGQANQTSNQATLASLTESLQQLQAASKLVGQTGPTIINAASPPTAPISPNPIRNGVLALVIGLVFGVGLAFLRERLDDGVNSREDAERSAGGLPVLGLIPLVDAWRGANKAHLAMVEDPTSPASEAYRTLRTSIQFLSIDEAKPVIGVTSALPDEGKTTTVANLAVSFAQAGRRVIVVSCDLRRPRLHTFFQESNAVGLTSVLLGEATLTTALQAVPDQPHLRVLPTGPTPPNPAELLSLDSVREVVETLAQSADVVLLDCPPVLPVTDTLLISRLVDGMLVVASAKTTSKRDLARTFAMLAQVQTPSLGTVLNRVPQGSEHTYGYGYGYGYYADDAAPPDQSPDERRLARSRVKLGRKTQGDAAIARETQRRAGASTTVTLTDDGFPATLGQPSTSGENGRSLDTADPDGGVSS